MKKNANLSSINEHIFLEDIECLQILGKMEMIFLIKTVIYFAIINLFHTLSEKQRFMSLAFFSDGMKIVYCTFFEGNKHNLHLCWQLIKIIIKTIII